MRRSAANRMPLLTLAVAAAIGIGTVAAVGLSARAIPAGATRITVGADPGGRTIPSGFVGLSLEYPAITAYAGGDPLAINPLFVQLIRNLAPGQAPSLRIGGDTTDWTWWPVPGMPRPPGVTFTLTPHWLAVGRALAHAVDARLILGINLEAGSTTVAAAEATALIAGLGSGHVRALELGNEPELYGSFAWYRTPDGRRVTGRPPGYSFADFLQDFSEFGHALPNLPLAGPAIGASGVMRNLGQFLASAPRLGLVTLHRYPLQLCYTAPRSSRYPSVSHLLSTAASSGLAAAMAPYAALSHAHGLPLRIDEINTVSCGGDARLSQTFASGLWALDAMFALAASGIDGVNIHTFPSAGYTLFTFSRRGGSWRASVRPEYYGLMMFARAAPAGARLLQVSAATVTPVRVWATRARDGTMRVVLINLSYRTRVVALRIAGAAGTAALERLRAPGPDAYGRVMLDGASIDPATATLPSTAHAEAISPIHGAYAVVVPPASAAMLTVR